MTRIILYIVFTLGAVAASLGQSNYENGMRKAFELWKSQKPTEAANLFERISKVEKDNWLPHYYIAQINTFEAFATKDKEKLTLLLEKATKHIEQAEKITPNNPEVLIQKAMINTAWIAFDGATYGMTLSGKNVMLYNQALKIAPNNPRAVLSKAEWNMGSARYFGQDTAPFCKDVEKAIELFATFKTEGEFAPDWGLDHAKQILASCK